MNIENCKVGFRCPKTLDALVETADPLVSYCPECDRGVHLCSSTEEFSDAVEKGWCVIIATDQVVGKFPRPLLDELGRGLFVGEVAPHYATIIDDKHST
jgi:hypothetical protein